MKFDLATQTMFAELIQRSLDAEFDLTYDERGRFVRIRSKGRLYWHYRRTMRGKERQTYVGPVADKAISERIARFAEIKSYYKQRRQMVRALAAAGLPAPDPLTGDVAEALWKAGLFRLRGVLVGTVAYQTYSGLLGRKLALRSLMTQDLDAAQFYSISHAVGDSLPPILDVLGAVDANFVAIPDISDPHRDWRFRNRDGYLVEFLTPNRGSDDYQDRPAHMPALGGASARALRHLDFLIYQPVRSVLLHKAGIPVLVPAPWRYAVHKLIIAGERIEIEKTDKDLLQAEELIIACLDGRRALELTEAYREARARGPRWVEKLDSGVSRLGSAVRGRLEEQLTVLVPRRKRSKS